MKVLQQTTRIAAEHFTVCAMPHDFFGNFGWPSIARLGDDRLIVAVSGLRTAHVCPFGRSVICQSTDLGQTWTSPHVVNDSPLDDRDMGIVALGAAEILVSWFTTDTRQYAGHVFKTEEMDPERRAMYEAALRGMTDETVAQCQGAWVRYSPDAGLSWKDPVCTPVTAPHGPTRLADGSLLYFGKEFGSRFTQFQRGVGRIAAYRSTDKGATWSEVGIVPVTPGLDRGNEHEPHLVQLPSGKLIGHIRIQNRDKSPDCENMGIVPFSISQTVSGDGGRSWSEPEPLNFHGSPPHLLLHSSGMLICSYGYRVEPRGTRIALSDDEGSTWSYDNILRDDATGDNGYPATVELPDGSLYTVQYQQMGAAENCRLVGSRWQLPA